MWRKLVPRTKFYGRSNGPVPAGRMLTWSVSGAEKVLFSAPDFAKTSLTHTFRDAYTKNYSLALEYQPGKLIEFIVLVVSGKRLARMRDGGVCGTGGSVHGRI